MITELLNILLGPQLPLEFGEACRSASLSCYEAESVGRQIKNYITEWCNKYPECFRRFRYPSHPPVAMSKRIRIFTPSDVAEHNTEESIWISYKGKVLDVTSFLPDHPGGEEFILRHAGKDVEDVMKDADEHVHSESAYGMLEEFAIGRLGAGEMVVSDDWVPADDFHPDNTDEEKDFEKNQFLDLRKPLFRQMWYANFRYVSHIAYCSLSDLPRVRRIISSRCISLVTSQSRRASSGLTTLRYS